MSVKADHVRETAKFTGLASLFLNRSRDCPALFGEQVEVPDKHLATLDGSGNARCVCPEVAHLTAVGSHSGVVSVACIDLGCTRVASGRVDRGDDGCCGRMRGEPFERGCIGECFV